MAEINNQKIKFLSGSQSTLDSLTSSQLGAFYLTNDTQRLYIGLDASAKPVPINQGIIFVNSTKDSSNCGFRSTTSSVLSPSITVLIVCALTFL